MVRLALVAIGLARLVAVAAGLMLATSALAATYVYVSNQTDADIAAYVLDAAASPQLKPIQRVPAGKMVMPMAASRDGKYLYAAVRMAPFSLYTYRVEAKSGQLRRLNTAPLPDNMVSIDLDATGEWLLATSYGGGTISVHRIGANGIPEADATQFFSSGGLKPHSIKVDRSNSTVYVPHLGTDEIRSYAFNPKSKSPLSEVSLSIATEKGFGPRHFVISPDNRFIYVVSELIGKVNVYERSAAGKLIELQSISSLAADSKIRPEQPRIPVGTPGEASFDETTAVWCADIQMSPNGKFLYTSERTESKLSQFSVDTKTGKLIFLGQVPTEKRPRGFAIDTSGRFLIASGQLSSTVSLYTIDQSTGLLSFVEKAPTGAGANWVTVISIP